MRNLLPMLAGLIAVSGFAGPDFYSVTHATTQFRQVAISPDGQRVAYVQGLQNADQSDSRNSVVYIAGSGAPRRITAGKGAAACQERDVAWSPNGAQVAFLSDCANPRQLQVYVADAATGKAKKLTSLKGYLQSPRWSPDGRRLAVLFTENATRTAGPTEAAAKDSGVVDEAIHEQRLALLDVRGGTGESAARMLSPADTYVYEYDWSPDGSKIAYTAAKGSGDNNWWIAELYTISTGSGEVRHVLRPEQQIAVPRWSKDGRQIAFIGGLMSDEGSTGGDIFSVPGEGGAARDLTPGIKASPSWLEWLPNGRMLYAETVDGGTAVGVLNPANGETETLWQGDESLRGGEDTVAVSADGKSIAAVRSSWELAPEVWAGPIGGWRQVTQANASLKPVWGKAEKLHWMSGGQRVQGWLLYPAGFVPGKKYGMIVSVHGGPASAKKPSWPGSFDLSALSSEGFFVLFPNPRGSYGAGEKFTQGNVKDFGYGDLHDILAGVDQAVHDLPVDEQRLGVGGWSYGGYMTMWTVTQTHRFRAAVAGAGIANWQSYYGENLIDQWMIPYFGKSVYDDPAIYARSSPITFIRNVETPTLIVVGDADEECPSPQSYEFWHALKTKGVKTQLVIYPGEGHHFHKQENVKDLMTRTIAWFKANLQ